MGVYKKDNRWYIDYYLSSGKRKREAVTIEGREPSTITLRDAQKALSIRKAEQSQGKSDIAKTLKPVKFDVLVEAYLKWTEEHHKRQDRDRVACKSLLAHFGSRNVYSITLWDVEKYKSLRKGQGRQPDTVNKELACLRQMFKLGLKKTLSVKIGKNPIEGMKLVKVPKLKPRVLKDWEFEKLYTAASPHFKPILLCAFMTGMRRGEIARLAWKEADLESGYIHVSETKNGEPRSIPIGNPLLGVLRDMEANRACEFVFTSQDKRPYTSNTMWKRAWETALRKAGIEYCRFHDLRHTFVSNLIVNEKEDFATVMALSGHKTMSMLKRYTHTQETAKRAAVQKLEKYVKITTMDAYLSTRPDIEPSVDSGDVA